MCPDAVVSAPVEVVGENFTQWERYADWANVHVERSEPNGPAAVGQTTFFAGKALGRTWHFIFKVEAVDPEWHQLDLHVVFAFGLQEKPHIASNPIDATSCRVQYGGDFIFPPGGWSRFLKTLGKKPIAASVDNSLRRLKRASERHYQQAQAKGTRCVRYSVEDNQEVYITKGLSE